MLRGEDGFDGAADRRHYPTILADVECTDDDGQRRRFCDQTPPDYWVLRVSLVDMGLEEHQRLEERMRTSAVEEV